MEMFSTCVYWVLVKVPRAETHRIVHHSPGGGRGALLMVEGGCQVIISKILVWTIVGCMSGECQLPAH